MFSFTSKLHLCRSKLNKWNHFSFNRTSSDIRLLQQKLKDIYARPFDPLNVAIEAHLLSNIHELWKWDELHWKQQSRVQWLQEGDHNTIFPCIHNLTLPI